MDDNYMQIRPICRCNQFHTETVLLCEDWAEPNTIIGLHTHPFFSSSETKYSL